MVLELLMVLYDQHSGVVRMWYLVNAPYPPMQNDWFASLCRCFGLITAAVCSVKLLCVGDLLTGLRVICWFLGPVGLLPKFLSCATAAPVPYSQSFNWASEPKQLGAEFQRTPMCQMTQSRDIPCQTRGHQVNCRKVLNNPRFLAIVVHTYAC